MPEDELDYIVVHELCHLIELNHSEKFYNCLGTVMPDYKDRERWIRENTKRIDYYADMNHINIQKTIGK